MTERGPRGERGAQGERGEQGMSPAVRNAIVILFLLGVAIGAANLLFTAHYVHATQAAQQRAGQMVEAKLCATLNGLTELKPPPGDPASNPSRAYLQEEHARLAQLGTDIGCKETP